MPQAGGVGIEEEDVLSHSVWVGVILSGIRPFFCELWYLLLRLRGRGSRTGGTSKGEQVVCRVLLVRG